MLPSQPTRSEGAHALLHRLEKTKRALDKANAKLVEAGESEVEMSGSDDEFDVDTALAMASPPQIHDKLFMATLFTEKRSSILVPEVIRRCPALGEVRLAKQKAARPGGGVKPTRVLVQHGSRGHRVISETELSALIQPKCKEIGDEMKKHKPDQSVLKACSNDLVKAFNKKRTALGSEESPIDVTKLIEAFKKHLSNTYGLLELDPKGAPLHLDGGVLEVKHRTNQRLGASPNLRVFPAGFRRDRRSRRRRWRQLIRC